MDPQQRLTLEVTWEALEHAGIPPQSLAGSNTACFMGVNSDDYGKLVLEDLSGIEAWMGIGTAYCGVPNRVSYHLDLRGPSTAVDAACASSLVSVHHGRQSLLTRETDLAIVGGVQVVSNPGMTVVLDKAGAISKHGECRSFDDEANGYGRGEGAAVIILKRFNDAIRDKDRILAKLKGSAVGQDGKTNGIMAPNGQAQEAVARTALGEIDPLSIQYVEAHATSTSVGDPVEIGAMSRLYGASRSAEHPCFVGSVKANIGHLEAGAGAVGFMKAVMAIQSGRIPPQANLKTLNKKIDWANAGITVPTEALDWPSTDGPRRASIASYGYGGTVSHALIEQGPERKTQQIENAGDFPTVLLLSAPQEKRNVTYAATLKAWMEGAGATAATISVASTLATRRGHHDFRSGLVVESRGQALKLLERFVDQPTGSVDPKLGSLISGRALNKKESGLVWLFSGHGAQWPGMGQELMAKEPVFRDAIFGLDGVIRKEAGFSAVHALTKADFDTTDKIQILTYAVQIGLAALLQSKGAQPDAIIGHSVGEIAAAVVSGALNALEGALVVCKRAVLYRQVMGNGAMALVQMPFSQTALMLEGRSEIWSAIDSSPSSCVVAGSVAAVEEFSKVCEAQSVKALKVNSDVAFHTPMLDRLAKPLLESLAEIRPRTPTVPLYSTTTKDPRQESPRDAHYWVHNMLNPVLLSGAVQSAIEDGYRVFQEISSHPVIAHSVNETLMEMDVDDFTVVPTLLRNKPAQLAVQKSLVTLWSKGASIEWTKSFGTAKWAHGVPLTQWQHRPYWKTVETASPATATEHDVDTHTLLGQCIPLADEEKTVFTSKLSNDNKPFPGSHPLHGTEIVPAAVLFNTFLSATGSQELNKIHLRVPVAVSAPRDIQVLVHGSNVHLASRLVQAPDDHNTDLNASWLTHTTAITKAELDLETPRYGTDMDIRATIERIGTELKPSFSVDYLSDVGVPLMGFPWKVTHHVGNTKEMLARVDVSPDTAADAALPWNPKSWAPVFDSATSIGSTLFYETPRLRMPANVANVSIRPGAVPPKIAYIYVQQVKETDTDVASDVTITDEEGKALAKFNQMRFAEIEGNPGASGSVEGLVHQLAWVPAQISETPTSLDRVVLVGYKDHSLIADYQRQLNKRRISVATVLANDGPLDSALDNCLDGDIIVYIPVAAPDAESIPAAAEESCQGLLEITKYVAAKQLQAKIYVVADDAIAATKFSSLSQAPLVGLSRIIASELPQLWGALIDVDSNAFPYQAIKYIDSTDVIRLEDSVAKVSRLRPMPKAKSSSRNTFQPRPEGTYLISGGFGSLGLEVAAHLAHHGARRIVLLSRRALPPRDQWSTLIGTMSDVIAKIAALEEAGVSVHCLPIDLSASTASADLKSRLEALSLPPVLGVVHAAGIVDDQLVLSTTPKAFSHVLAPKINGALALHDAFPTGALDFFILFSSCGQLFGFPGQASYASGNAFLDSLAEHRRLSGDNAVAFQWTSWRGVGGMGDNEFVEAELENRGITSITRSEAFQAWDEVARRNVSQAVVLRSRVLDADEELPMPILEQIAVRRATVASTGADTPASSGAAKTDLPPPGPERAAYLTTTISGCVASVLQLAGPDEVDPKAALSDLGMDSVMTATFRRQLQQTLKVKVPVTLVWGHPTVSHLVKWFGEQLA